MLLLYKKTYLHNFINNIPYLFKLNQFKCIVYPYTFLILLHVVIEITCRYRLHKY